MLNKFNKNKYFRDDIMKLKYKSIWAYTLFDFEFGQRNYEAATGDIILYI